MNDAEDDVRHTVQMQCTARHCSRPRRPGLVTSMGEAIRWRFAAKVPCLFRAGRKTAVAGVVSSVLVPALVLFAVGNPGQARAAGCEPAPEKLQRNLARIWREAPDRVGIAVRRVDCPWILGSRLNEYFPQQSVSKLWVAATLLDTVDRRQARLEDPVILTSADLSVFNQTTRHAILAQGRVRTTIGQLLRNAMSESDNISNGRLLRQVGGPAAVRSFLSSRRLGGIRFGPGETALQSAIAGLTWHSSYSYARQFEQARARLPIATRRTALRAYLDNPVDGATPAAITGALARLARGGLLSEHSTRHLLDIMAQSRSGPRRLKGGIAPGWRIYHKTGTGQRLEETDTGYNDVGLLEAPDGTRYAVAVMIAETRRPIAARMALMQAVSRAVTDYHGTRPTASRP